MKASLATNASLARFAWRIAGPREFVIAGAINAAFAYWLFWGTDRVPLAGGPAETGPSVMTMAVPTGWLLPALSSFFGVLVGSQRSEAGTQPKSRRQLLTQATRIGLVRGLIGLAVMSIAAVVCGHIKPTPNLDGRAVTIAITVVAGTAAYFLHATAILRARRVR